MSNRLELNALDLRLHDSGLRRTWRDTGLRISDVLDLGSLVLVSLFNAAITGFGRSVALFDTDRGGL